MRATRRPSPQLTYSAEEAEERLPDDCLRLRSREQPGFLWR